MALKKIDKRVNIVIVLWTCPIAQNALIDKVSAFNKMVADL